MMQRDPAKDFLKVDFSATLSPRALTSSIGLLELHAGTIPQRTHSMILARSRETTTGTFVVGATL